MEAASGPRSWHAGGGERICRGDPGAHPFNYVLYFFVLLFQIIRKALSEEKRVSTKTSAADLVTETDHLVEGLIISELQKRFPSHR